MDSFCFDHPAIFRGIIDTCSPRSFGSFVNITNNPARVPRPIRLRAESSRAELWPIKRDRAFARADNSFTLRTQRSIDRSCAAKPIEADGILMRSTAWSIIVRWNGPFRRRRLTDSGLPRRSPRISRSLFVRERSLFGHLIANGILGPRNGTLLHFIDVFMHLLCVACGFGELGYLTLFYLIHFGGSSCVDCNWSGVCRVLFCWMWEGRAYKM